MSFLYARILSPGLCDKPAVMLPWKGSPLKINSVAPLNDICPIRKTECHIEHTIMNYVRVPWVRLKLGLDAQHYVRGSGQGFF
jgi:hypothetical protein